MHIDAEKIVSVNHISCLIAGPIGPGKEHLAQFIPDHSPRREQPFEKINCSALGDDLLESRLFGHKAGSFTAATTDHEGIFKRVNGGRTPASSQRPTRTWLLNVRQGISGGISITDWR